MIIHVIYFFNQSTELRNQFLFKIFNLHLEDWTLGFFGFKVYQFVEHNPFEEFWNHLYL
jgi:hypothetical protein